MKKVIFLFFILVVLVTCSTPPAEVETIMEDGMEVVVNRLEPFPLAGESSHLGLEEMLVIDTERDDLAKMGLTDIRTFFVDSKDNIYLCQTPREGEHLVFKFSSQGEFLASFGDWGQGPGEVLWPDILETTSQDELFIVDSGKKKIMFFDINGEFLRDLPFSFIYLPRVGLILLPNDFYLVYQITLGENRELERVLVSLYNSDLTKLKDLQQADWPGADNDRINAFIDMPVIAVSKNHIFIGFEKISPDILVYDLSGNLLRKIRRETRPVAVPQRLKQKLKETVPSDLFKQIYFPKNMPLFQYMFTDEAGRLYVMTPHIEDAAGQNIYDIFNSEGIFIAQKSLGYFDRLKQIYLGSHLNIKVKNNRLYCLREKASGFIELVVYRMSWQ